MVLILYILIGAFLATSVAFSTVCAASTKAAINKSFLSRVKLHMLGFSTRKAIRLNLRPDHQKVAIGLFMVREALFVAIIVVALLEYYLRVS